MLHGSVHQLFAVGFDLAQFRFKFVAERHELCSCRADPGWDVRGAGFG